MMVNLYTDGACSVKRRLGGWSFVAVYTEKGQEDYVFSTCGWDKDTTNNVMELSGVLFGLLHLIRTGQKKVTVYTDSQYVQKGISEWIHAWEANKWKTSKNKPVKNIQEWKNLKAASKLIDVKWEWVKAHNGDKYNEMADKLAAGMVEKLKS